MADNGKRPLPVQPAPSCSALLFHLRANDAPNPRFPGQFFNWRQKTTRLYVKFGIKPQTTHPRKPGWIECRTYKYESQYNTWNLVKRSRAELPLPALIAEHVEEPP